MTLTASIRAMIRRVRIRYEHWRTRNRLLSLDPAYRALDEQERENRRQHKPVKYVQEAKRQYILAAMKGER